MQFYWSRSGPVHCGRLGQGGRALHLARAFARAVLRRKRRSGSGFQRLDRQRRAFALASAALFRPDSHRIELGSWVCPLVCPRRPVWQSAGRSRARLHRAAAGPSAAAGAGNLRKRDRRKRSGLAARDFSRGAGDRRRKYLDHQRLHPAARAGRGETRHAQCAARSGVLLGFSIAGQCRHRDVLFRESRRFSWRDRPDQIGNHSGHSSARRAVGGAIGRGHGGIARRQSQRDGKCLRLRRPLDFVAALFGDFRHPGLDSDQASAYRAWLDLAYRRGAAWLDRRERAALADGRRRRADGVRGAVAASAARLRLDRDRPGFDDRLPSSVYRQAAADHGSHAADHFRHRVHGDSAAAGRLCGHADHAIARERR
ncbi:MAG: hypothetical protein BWZ10_02622 [candidate division BRC1 bacterium ADurb.BinA364]|nr:MAG: hypothetical protein BWZ10_02622 [candidate division BRC1 bacterium ADurb.BinA364]